MGDRGSNCCCAFWPPGFDVYAQPTIYAFSGQQLRQVCYTDQASDPDGNWFVEWLTRANLIGAEGAGGATPRAYSIELNALSDPLPLPPTTEGPPAVEDETFVMGAVLRTVVNTKTNQVAWYGRFQTMRPADLFDEGPEPAQVYELVPGEDSSWFVVISSGAEPGSPVGAMLADYWSVGPAGSGYETNYVPGWTTGDHAFDADRTYWNATYLWTFAHYYVGGVTAGLWNQYIERTTFEGNRGVSGAGLIGTDYASDESSAALTSAQFSISLGDGYNDYTKENTNDYIYPTDGPWVTFDKSFFEADRHLGLYYETSHLAPWEPDSDATVVLPGEWQNYWDDRGQPWASLIALNDPTTAFGVALDLEIYELSSATTTSSSANRVTSYERSLLFGEVDDATGLVSGTTVWASGPYEVTTGLFGARDLHGITAAAIECDSWSDTRVGFYQTSAISFSATYGSRSRSTITANSKTNPVGGATWPSASFDYWSSNGLGSTLAGDRGPVSTMVSQLNNGSLTRAFDDAFYAVVHNGAEVFKHPAYHIGWVPQAIRACHDDSGDFLLLERHQESGVSRYPNKAAVSIAAYSLGVADVTAGTEYAVAVNVSAGPSGAGHCFLIAAHGGTISGIRVTNAAGTITGSYTLESTGTVGGFDYAVISINATSSNNRSVRVMRSTDGLVMMAGLYNHNAGSTTISIGAVGATPSSPSVGDAACQACFAVSPDGAATQEANIHLTGSGKVCRTAGGSDGTNQVFGIVTGLSKVVGTVDHAWDFGSGVTDSIGITVSTSLGSAGSWALDGYAEEYIDDLQGWDARLRRVSSTGETQWVLRRLYDADADIRSTRLYLDCGDRLAVVHGGVDSTPPKPMFAVDAATGEARQFTVGGDALWPILNFAIVPQTDELSTQNLAGWIADDPIGLG